MKGLRLVLFILAMALLMAGIIGEHWTYHLKYKAECERNARLLQNCQRQMDNCIISAEECKRGANR